MRMHRRPMLHVKISIPAKLIMSGSSASGDMCFNGHLKTRIQKKKAFGIIVGDATGMNQEPIPPRKPSGGAIGVFLAKNRESLTQEATGRGGLFRLVAKKWKALSTTEQWPYHVEFQEQKKQYEKHMEAYIAAVTSEESEVPRKESTTHREPEDLPYRGDIGEVSEG